MKGKIKAEYCNHHFCMQNKKLRKVLESNDQTSNPNIEKMHEYKGI